MAGATTMLTGIMLFSMISRADAAGSDECIKMAVIGTVAVLASLTGGAVITNHSVRRAEAAADRRITQAEEAAKRVAVKELKESLKDGIAEGPKSPANQVKDELNCISGITRRVNSRR